MARGSHAGKKSSRGTTPSRHFVARGHRSATPSAGDRALALLPRPPLAPYRMGEPIAVHVHRSSWQPEPSMPRSSKPAKRGSPEWLAKVIAGTRAGIKTMSASARRAQLIKMAATLRAKHRTG